MSEFEDLKINIGKDWNATIDQRDKANEAIRFNDVPGGQWEDWMPQNFINRPRMEYNLTAQAVKRANTEWVNNRFRVKFRPDDAVSSDADAKILNGLYMKDERRSNGFQSYDNAISEMFKCGVGAWEVKTQFADEADIERDDQDIAFEPIYAAYNTVIWDRNAKSYDKREALRCTVLTYMNTDSFLEQWPDKTPNSTNVPIDRRGFNWFTPEDIVIAKTYEVEIKTEEVVIIRDAFGQRKEIYVSDYEEQKQALKDDGFEVIKRRKAKRRVIWQYIMNGDEFLEPRKRIAGTLIPVIPVYGFLSWIDGHEWYTGIVQPLMDANRIVNMEVTTFAERSATTIKPVPILAPQQVQGLENYWAEAHTANYPYMLLKPIIGPDGTPLPPQQPAFLQPPVVDQNSMAALEFSSSFIQQETGGSPQDVMDPDASGKAINAMIQRVDQMTGVMFENIAKSMKRCGEVWRSMNNDVRDQTRFFTLLNDDETTFKATLHDFTIDNKTGMPKYINDITKGEYEVIVDTGPAYASKRQENVATLRDVYSAVPDHNPLKDSILDSLIDNLDIGGIDELKKLIRQNKLRAGTLEPESEEDMQFMQRLQAQAQQPNENQELIQAVANRENSEALMNETKANLNMTAANLNQAKGAEIINSIKVKNFETANKAQQQGFDNRQQSARLLLGRG